MSVFQARLILDLAGDVGHVLPLGDLQSLVAIVPGRDVFHPLKIRRNRAEIVT